MKMRSVAILLAVSVCTGCSALSPADEAVERISYCVAEERMDSLADLLPSLRISVANANEVIALASTKTPSILGASLAVAKRPREAAHIFVNMLADGDSSVLHDAGTIARQAIDCYKALDLRDECDTFVVSVDEAALRLPVPVQAGILVGCTDPARLGRYLCRLDDTTMIEAVRMAYGTDSIRLKQFNNALK